MSAHASGNINAIKCIYIYIYVVIDLPDCLACIYINEQIIVSTYRKRIRKRSIDSIEGNTLN
jgi:hypothetical protein